MPQPQSYASRRPRTTLIARAALALLALIPLAGCAAGLGKRPSAALRATYASSPQFDAARGAFLNLPEPVLDSFWTANSQAFRTGIDVTANGARPGYRLPTAKPDMAAFRAADGDTALKVIWVGHSTIALRMDTTVILIDPVFGRASPLSFYEGSRFQPPAVTRNQLPDVDVIVISHEHYDHLERATVEHYAKKDVTFVVPLGISSHLRYWGVKPERIVERDWWESTVVAGVEFTATPAWHSSGRLKRGTNYTQWSSWVMRTARHKIYFTGDTGYGSHFREIGERFGPFDMVFLETGQYSRAWRSHMQPQHWPVAMQDLRSVNWFPVHWGVFSFAPHDWDEPIRAADSLAPLHGLTLWTPLMGEVVDLNVKLKAPQTNLGANAESARPFPRWWIRDRDDK